MKSLLSIIYLQTNSASAEKIAAGLLAVSENEVFFHVSEQKLKLASKLSSADVLKHAEISFALITEKVAETNKENKSVALIKKDSLFTKEYITYLNKYSKGLIQFDAPKSFAGTIDKKMFKVLFEQFIGSWDEKQLIEQKAEPFQSLIKKKLNKPVFKQKADINYTLKPEKIAGILMPKDITLISKNGNILAAQAIDFNKSEETIIKQAYEYEVTVNSLEELGQKEINKNHHGTYYLLFNQPQQNSAQEKLLHEIQKTKSGMMQVVQADFLQQLETTLETNDYIKFSQFEATFA